MLYDLDTPCLLLDVDKTKRNIQRLRERIRELGVGWRPHMKTAKCIEVGKLIVDGSAGPITVSTLKEAEEFSNAGFNDILYAVGISPKKLSRVSAIRRHGVSLKIILDSLEQATMIRDYVADTRETFEVLIEIDCDNHRAGIKPTDHKLLLSIADVLQSSGVKLRGVMTHAGESYTATNKEALIRAAEQERKAVVDAASTLRASDFECPIVSVGSTPTAHFAEDLAGITECRPGNFMFFDLVMNGLGVCNLDDIAISVLTTVIGHQRDKGWILVDAGWMAMSRDRGTASQAVDYGYGMVCNESGEPIDNLIMTSANQEHGIISLQNKTKLDLIKTFPIGTRLRILPNHACATAAQYEHYQILREGVLEGRWSRFNGW